MPLIIRKILKFTSFDRNIHLLRLAVGEKNYIFALSIVTGLISGLAAVALKFIAHYIQHICYAGSTTPSTLEYFMRPLYPAIGIFFCIIFVKLFVKGVYEKGLAGVIISAGATGEIPKQKTWSHILTSGISVGCGVSAGLEAPTALTGSAIGSNIAKRFRLGKEGRTLLLACGGGAGVSAVFNSPVAGALFACEILLTEFSIPALIPLLIASAGAAVVSEVLFPHRAFSIEVTDWAIQNIPYYILLGLLAGLVSAYVIRTSLFINKKFSVFKNPWLKGLIGCVILYVVFLLFPTLRGEGYGFVNMLVAGKEFHILDGSPVQFLFNNAWSLLALTGLLVILKAAVSNTGVESGGDGGIFAPSMFTGAFLGFFVARMIRMLGLYGHAQICETNFIAIGMGAVLAGVMHAPMTGIFLIAEITGGYKLFIPLMIVASLSFFVCRAITKYNVYKSAIAAKGGTPDENTDAAALKQLLVGNLVETNFVTVRPDFTLRQLLGAVMKSKRNIFPVVTEDKLLVGIVTLDNIRPFLLDQQLYDVALVYDIMSDTGPTLKETDTLKEASRLFEQWHAWNIPVVKTNGEYAGFVSKSGVFDRYRNVLRNKKDLF